jgi:thiol-disulfide isomerase/thioredoxin
MQGRTFEQMSGAIQRYLADQAQKRREGEPYCRAEESGPAIRRRHWMLPRTVRSASPRRSVTGQARRAGYGRRVLGFQCPFCQRVMPTLKELRSKYGDKMRLVWKDFPPLDADPTAGVCRGAGRQLRARAGKFWEFHDTLFGNQSALQARTNLKKYAATWARHREVHPCLDSSKYEARVQDALAVGGALGISSTPTVFVNGRLINGAQPIEVFQSVIDDELARGGK